jgi:hypothetical protein
MRTVQTFVLRLLLDSERPGAIIGVLHAALGSEEWAFTDAQTLVAILQRASTGALEESKPAETSQKSRHPI